MYGPGSHAQAHAARERIADHDVTSLWGAIPDPGADIQDAEHFGNGPDGAPVIVVGDGARTASSCVALERRRPASRFVFDVNGFYAALGVSPEATVEELSRAYHALGGQDDPWLTEALMILRDPDKRAAYDRMLPHQLFNDSTTYAQVRRAEALQALREGIPRTGTVSDQSMYGGARGTQKWDSAYTESRTEKQPPWEYAYYLWNLLYRDSAVTSLPDWQHLLIDALNNDEHPTPLQFAVGRCAAGIPATAIQVAGTLIAFLPYNTDPTTEQAERVARRLRELATDAQSATSDTAPTATRTHTTPSLEHAA